MRTGSLKTVSALGVTAVALAGTVFVGTAAASTTQTGKAALQNTPRLANVLTCETRAQGKTGAVACQNNTVKTVAFRAVVVCGTALDVKGEWVTLNPGQTNTSVGYCGSTSTGVGSINWEEG